MNLGELLRLYVVDKQIKGFSPNTIKAYALQLQMLASKFGFPYYQVIIKASIWPIN